ncbi:hypothetical protein Nit79A3_2006 [Nitrosomonas sp. Is79A3]|uniref:hypothetical protein n=1 Tax=Nitrosomonas sp. (strain Is79A3) TaxID=261292 RepID=UPI000215CF13
MYEASVFMANGNHEGRIQPIVLNSSDILDNFDEENYSNYWTNQFELIKLKISKASPARKDELIWKYNVLSEICLRSTSFIRYIQIHKNRKTSPSQNLKHDIIKDITEYIFKKTKEIELKKNYTDSNLGVISIENGNYSDDNLFNILLEATEKRISLKFLRLAGPTDFRQNIINFADSANSSKSSTGHNYIELLIDERIPKLEFILANPFCESLLSKLDSEQNSTWEITKTKNKIIKYAKSLLFLSYRKDKKKLSVGFHEEELIWNLCILDSKKILLRSYGEKGEIRGHKKSDDNDGDKSDLKEVIFETGSNSLIAESLLKYYRSISKKTYWLSDVDHLSDYLKNECKYPSLYRGNAIKETSSAFLKKCMDSKAQLVEKDILNQQIELQWFRTPCLNINGEHVPWIEDVLSIEHVQGCNMFELFYKLHELSFSDPQKKQVIENILGYLFSHSLHALSEFRVSVAIAQRDKYPYSEKLRSGIKEISPFLTKIHRELIENAIKDLDYIGRVASKQETTLFRDSHLKNRLIRFDLHLNGSDASVEINRFIKELLSINENRFDEYFADRIFDIDFEGANLEVSIWDDIAHLFMFENIGFFSLDDNLFDKAEIDSSINLEKFRALGSNIIYTIETIANIAIPDDQKEGFWMSALSRVLREFFRRVWYANIMPVTYLHRYGLEGRDYYLRLAILCCFQTTKVNNLKKVLFECNKKENRIWGGIAYRSSINYTRPNFAIN